MVNSSSSTLFSLRNTGLMRIFLAVFLLSGTTLSAFSQSVGTSSTAPVVPPLAPFLLDGEDSTKPSTRTSPVSTTAIKNSSEPTIKSSSEPIKISSDGVECGIERLNETQYEEIYPEKEAIRSNKYDQQSTRNRSTRARSMRNEFQQFVAQSLGFTLPIFGRNLFSCPSTSFSPSQDTAVPGDYVLGIGDELYIRATGALDIDYHASIDPNGMISIPRVGSFSLAGVRYSQAESVIHQHVAKYFRDFHLYVSLGHLRSIRVYLVGHVKRPGAYTVSSLSTLVNTLLTAGGPSATGSLRTIQVKRAGRLITNFDLYDLLLKGDKSKDIRLLSEDVIYVAPVGKLVAVNGSVNQPAIYEVRDRETLEDILNFAGGKTPIASDKVSIERIINHDKRTVEQFSLDPIASKHPVNDGDLITLQTISRKFDQVVTLRGHVTTPIRMPWHAQMHIKDLISSKDMLITRNYYASLEQIKDITPSKERLTSNDLQDSKNQATEPNWEYATIERLRDDLSTEIIPFSLTKALAGNKENNLLLQPSDIITVYSKDDIQISKFQKTGIVKLEGEFKTSGVYQFKNGETLRDVVQHAGGITDYANLYAIEVQRESTRQQQLKRYNQWLDQMEKDILRKENNHINLSQDDAIIAKSQLDQRRQLIDRLRSIQPTGRIVLGFKDNFKPTLHDLPDMMIEDGDKIVLPSRTPIISIVGAVTNDGNFLYRPEKTLSDYLNDAGGGSEFADISNVYIIRTDGSITGRASSHGLFSWLESIGSPSIQPGDTIVIPEKVGGQSFLSIIKDIGTILYQYGLGAAAIKVLK